jgi:ATP-dependent helicase/nuclease subunit A
VTSGSDIQRPTGAQIAAADPAVSAWVGANAGSGKTRVLTQRVARLLLENVKPERILCLTYTKAAAAEMQTRLFEMLGGWAMARDDWLGAELAAIAGKEAPVADAEALARARRLFARALETPGGLKIQTIHAFCDALLRRFPLEAGVSPRFEVLDERQSALMIAAIRADMARDAEAGSDTSFDGVAERLNEGGVDDLISAVLAGRGEFPEGGIDDRLEAHFGPAVRSNADEIALQALSLLDWPRLRGHADTLERLGGSKFDKPAAAALRFADPNSGADPIAGAWGLVYAFLKDSGTARRSTSTFPVKSVKEFDPGALEMTEALMDWSMEVAGRLRAVVAAARARDLDAFANTLLGRYRQAKDARALLDFDDLVSRASGLLTRSDMAAWALYRLDRGIDHILVDEAQDTSPGQWAVIRAIAHEFHSGAGAREVSRTLFVVGDEKQSIYSFQGAEPQAFGENRTHFGDWLEGAGGKLARPDLVTSFRSAPGILRYVDAVFEGEAAEGLTVDNAEVTHAASRMRDASRVDLWPLVEAEEAEQPGDWSEIPVDAPSPGSAKLRLAEMLAAEIRRMIDEDCLPAREGQPGRRVRAGDILVLVTRRDALAQGLIRALKGQDLPVAGSDRLSLAGELAVKDLLALVKVATTPGDDLSLAALLRSPLCDISEDDLFALAHGREGSLWRAVMKAEARHPESVAMLQDMADQADYLRPYEFLERVLIRHDGRRRLLARLGPEAEDPIDELLVQALVYEAREAPSLAGFIAWIEAGDIKVKREMERGAGEVRVMTVHGAKGLESPVVILPDTMSKPGGGGRPVLLPAASGANQPPLMLWAAAKSEDDPVTGAARAEAATRENAERKRLMYVALTRAEDWLILCGAGQEGRKTGTWYEALEQGMERLGSSAEMAGPEGLGRPIQRREDHPVEVRGAPPVEATAPAPQRPERPGWMAPAPHEERAKRLSPSSLAAHEEEGGAGLGRTLALTRGTAVHMVLERLADEPAELRRELAARLLGHAFPGLPPETAAGVVDEALAVFDAPFAADIFGPGTLAEAGITLDLPEVAPQLMLGRVDRLVINRHRVLVVDFKTDAQPPATAEAVPEAYLAQLGCYRAGLAALYRERPVEAAILWTAGPDLMLLDNAAMDRALERYSQGGS